MSDQYISKQEEPNMEYEYSKIERGLTLFANMAHANAAEHGFYDDHDKLTGFLATQGQHELSRVADRSFVIEQLAKIAGEAGEAVAAIQRGLVDDEIAEEFADILIRTVDLAAHCGFDIGTATVAKMRKNSKRPYKHGKTC